eukprot:359959-Hanusia_phi.AAC.1
MSMFSFRSPVRARKDIRIAELDDEAVKVRGGRGACGRGNSEEGGGGGGGAGAEGMAGKGS